MLSQWIQLFKIYQYRPQIMIWIESESKWIVSPLQRWVMTLWISLLMAEIPAYAQTSVRRLLHADSSGQGQHAASQPHCKHRRQLSHLFNSSLHHHRKTPLMLHHTDSNLYIYFFCIAEFCLKVFFFSQRGATDHCSYQSNSLVSDERLCFPLCTTTFISYWRDKEITELSFYLCAWVDLLMVDLHASVIFRITLDVVIFKSADKGSVCCIANSSDISWLTNKSIACLISYSISIFWFCEPFDKKAWICKTAGFYLKPTSSDCWLCWSQSDGSNTTSASYKKMPKNVSRTEFFSDLFVSVVWVSSGLIEGNS